jgi:hypothetical protein
VRGQRFLDVFDRLLAEEGDGRQLALGLRDDIADRLDAGALQAAVRAQTELELLDREVFERFDRVDGVEPGQRCGCLRVGFTVRAYDSRRALGQTETGFRRPRCACEL